MSSKKTFDRQISEDTRDPSSKWGKDIIPTEAGAEDPDDEDNLPIPDASTYREPTPGKSRVRGSIRDWSDDEDCYIMEVHNLHPDNLIIFISDTS